MCVGCAYGCISRRYEEYIAEPNSGFKPNARIGAHMHCMLMYAYSSHGAENGSEFSLAVSTHGEA